jgi:hypothetical protein
LALQLSGGIPQDASIPISSLNAQRVLATERNTLPATSFVPYAVESVGGPGYSRMA